MRSARLLRAGIVFASLALALVAAGAALSLRVARAATVAPPASAALAWDETLELRQSYNACASYSTMAFAYATRGERLDPEAIKRSIRGKMANGYVYPWGITSYLRLRGLRPATWWLRFLSPRERADWVRSAVAGGRPVVLIVGNRKYLHYVTVLGYSGKVFDLYDSDFVGNGAAGNGAAGNGARPGNRAMGETALLDWWWGARFKGLRLDAAICAAP